MHKYANPTRFMRWAEACQPYLLALGILLGFGGMIWGLSVPPDEEMQELIKPLFVHVPSAGLSLIVYGSMSIAAFVALVWRHPCLRFSVLPLRRSGLLLRLLPWLRARCGASQR